MAPAQPHSYQGYWPDFKQHFDGNDRPPGDSAAGRHGWQRSTFVGNGSHRHTNRLHPCVSRSLLNRSRETPHANARVNPSWRNRSRQLSTRRASADFRPPQFAGRLRGIRVAILSPIVDCRLSPSGDSRLPRGHHRRRLDSLAAVRRREQAFTLHTPFKSLSQNPWLGSVDRPQQRVLG